MNTINDNIAIAPTKATNPAGINMGKIWFILIIPIGRNGTNTLNDANASAEYLESTLTKIWYVPSRGNSYSTEKLPFGAFML